LFALVCLLPASRILPDRRRVMLRACVIVCCAYAGGEKTVAALALLFAIHSCAKPCFVLLWGFLPHVSVFPSLSVLRSSGSTPLRSSCWMRWTPLSTTSTSAKSPTTSSKPSQLLLVAFFALDLPHLRLVVVCRKRALKDGLQCIVISLKETFYTKASPRLTLVKVDLTADVDLYRRLKLWSASAAMS
jgi:hypothetical protein